MACKDPTFALCKAKSFLQLRRNNFQKGLFGPLTTCSTTCHFKFTKFKEHLAPSSSKFNPKDVNFWLFFLVLLVRNLKTQGNVIKSWCVFSQKPKNTRKSHWKLLSFRCLFGMNFEDEGAICVAKLHLWHPLI